jgi:hypothetical protein
MITAWLETLSRTACKKHTLEEDLVVVDLGDGDGLDGELAGLGVSDEQGTAVKAYVRLTSS